MPDALLALQIQRTTEPDEMVFVMYHQINELLFKMILWEINQVSNCEVVNAPFFTEKLKYICSFFTIVPVKMPPVSMWPGNASNTYDVYILLCIFLMVYLQVNVHLASHYEQLINIQNDAERRVANMLGYVKAEFDGADSLLKLRIRLLEERMNEISKLGTGNV